MAKDKGITFALLLVFILHDDAFALSGALAKSFYVPVIKGNVVSLVGETENEELEEPATPTNVLVIISQSIQIEVDEELSTEDEEIEVEDSEAPQLEEEIE